MKKFKVIETGEIRIGYELRDLEKSAFEKVLNDQVEFEIECMDENSPYWYLVKEMEKMQTPWFLGEAIYHDHFASLCQNIEANGYLFDEDGDLLGLTYHTINNKVVKTTIGKKEREVEFIKN